MAQRKADWLLVAVIAAIAVLWGLLLWLLPSEGTAVQVTVDGRLVATYPLNEDRTQTISGVDGGQNLLVIASGRATVTQASCPDKICVRHRAINRAGQSIICLPNKVVITVIGGRDAVDGEA